MQEYISMLNSKEGISYAEGSLNTENWIIKLDLNFASLAHLKAGLIDLSKDINQHETSEEVNQLKLSYANGRSEEQRLNSSHVRISYAVFCLKKKTSHALTRIDTSVPCATP